MRTLPQRSRSLLHAPTLAILIVLAGCSDLPTLSEANNRPMTPSEGQAWMNAAMDDAKTEIEAFRGASFLRPVKGVWVRAGGFDSLVRALGSQLGLYAEPPSWNLTERTMIALGMVDTLGQWGKSQETFDQGSILGFYVTENATLYVFDDPDREGLRHTVVHEMVHALQDQRFGLDELSDRMREDDEDNALRALVEGEAEYVTQGVLSEGASPQVLHDFFLDYAPSYDSVARMVSKWSSSSGLPLAMTLPTYTPYLMGPQFVSRARLRGGWAAVDSLFRAPAKSTREVLWDDATPPADWNPGGAPAVSGAWTPLQTGRFGVSRLASLLHGHLASTQTLQGVLGGWRGDRFWSFESDSGYGLLWRLRFASDSAARTFAAAFWASRAAKRERLGQMSLPVGGSVFLAIPSRGKLGSQLEVSGTEVAFAENFAPTEADSLVSRLLAMPDRSLLAARGAVATFAGQEWDPPRAPITLGHPPRIPGSPGR
jgi:hypothetical protein